MAYVKGQPFIQQFIDPATGLLMVNGTVLFYLTGTSTPTPYYTSSAGASGGTSLTLNSAGKPPTDIYFDTSITYKIVVKNAAGSVLDTIDPFNVLNGGVLAATFLENQTVATVAAMVALSPAEGDTCRTIGYYDGWAATLEPKGGGKYTAATLAEVRAVKADGAWVPDEYENHTAANGLVWMLDRESNVLRSEQCGVSVTSVSVDNAAILNSLLSTIQSRSTLTLPNGEITVNAPIDIGVARTLRLKLQGEGPKTELIAGAIMSSIVRLPQTTGATNQFANSFIESIIFNGNSKADYCMKGCCNFNTFKDLSFYGALVASTDVSYGWDNTWYNCYWISGVRGFINSEGQNNQNTFVGCKWGAHSEFGMKLQPSYGIGFVNCVWELCAKAAIFAYGVQGMTFDASCYFDNNAASGHTFTTPAVTVYADVILQGSSSETTMDTAYPCRGVKFTAPFYSIGAGPSHALVYAVSTIGLNIDTPTMLVGDTNTVLVKTYGSTTTNSAYSRNRGLRIVSHNDDTEPFVIENSTLGFDGQQDILIDNVNSINLLDSMANWTSIVGGAASTFIASSEVHGLGPLISVYELDAGASTSTSESFGMTIDATQYPDLAGKPISAFIDVKNETAGATTTVTVGGWSDTHTGTTWRRFYVHFNMPASGTFNFTVKKTGNADRTFVAIPRIIPLGGDYRKLVA